MHAVTDLVCGFLHGVRDSLHELGLFSFWDLPRQLPHLRLELLQLLTYSLLSR